MIRRLRFVFLMASLMFSGLAFGQLQPEEPLEGRGYLSSIQGSTIYIDRRLYKITSQTRQGETLSDHDEAEWSRKVEFSVGDEVLFGTVNEQSKELDFILRRLK